MKKGIKIISILTIILIAIASMMPVYAAINENSSASITINNVTEGDQVAGYKIIDIVYDTVTNSYTRVWNSRFEEYFRTANTGAPELTVEQFIELQPSETITDGIRNVLAGIPAYINEKSITLETQDLAVVTAGDTSNVVFSNVKMGGYFMVPQSTKDVYQTMFVPIEPTADTQVPPQYELNNKAIDAKKSEINVSSSADKTSATIGDEIEYTITVDLPSTYAQDGKNRILKITDVIESGLVLNDDSIVVNIVNNGVKTALELTTDYVITSSSEQGFVIDISNNQYTKLIGNNQLEITYTATLTKDAPLTTGTIDNFDGIDTSITLDYSCYPYVEGKYETEKTSTTPLYTYGIKIEKVDKNDTTIKLQNAEFELYKEADCINKIANITTAGTGDVIVTDENGNATFNRLAAGTYYIKEIIAPTGYALDNTAKEVTIEENYESEDGYKVIQITNSKGLLLPTTGGSDALILTVVGFVLIIFSTIALIVFSNKMKNKIEK